jgi:hypothetical protein
VYCGGFGDEDRCCTRPLCGNPLGEEWTVVLSLSATAVPGGAEEITPARCCVEVSDPWEHLQLSFGKKAGHMLRMMDRDDGVRVAVPEADWAMDGRVIQTRRGPHESPVRDRCPSAQSVRERADRAGTQRGGVQ